ncbi:BAG family molecular chaperone regulator 2-like [Haliotis rubra]|uniref:BAG family molecular chaperone regulator 2-like n=1 Tax=Haliotis rubra TaxID=36100 RepID=UPI001EE6008D|nr:BAG family molecular chaperone regulator 2-like [Haliotis rubra]
MAASSERDEEGESARLLTFLDEAEKRVESFRTQAVYLMQERASLLTILQQLKEESLKCSLSEGDRQQFLANIDRLRKRSKSATIEVNTVRNETQEEALSKINDILDRLQGEFEEQPEKCWKQLQIYYNTCLAESSGAVDLRFQNLVLDCTVDDQKNLRRKLDNWLRNQDFKSNGTL